MQIKIRLTNEKFRPVYSTDGAAGADLRARLDYPIIIGPGDRRLIHTGVFLDLPKGTEAQIRPRSGIALYQGVTVLNSPGTIDSDYNGEIGVILYNSSRMDFTVNPMDRIAQMIISRYDEAVFTSKQDVEDNSEDQELTVAVRGVNGFGHTGIN